MTDAPQTSYGQYQLIEKIAQGGMAEIFRGKALGPSGVEKDVVVKRILPHIAANPEFVDMLVDEAKIAVQLSHGNIAQIYDLGKIADDYFIVMEYIEGKTLSQISKRLKIQNRLMPIPHALAIAIEIARALDYMHRKTDEQGHPLGIIHRDISPQNIILSTAGTIKIIDFGIAKAKNKVSTTDSGVLKGKFAYMSPEHAEGEPLDQRTDIFSLGVVLFELLTGQRLFKGKNNIDTIRKVKKTRVDLPSSLRSTIPRELDAIILKILSRDREQRYASADLVVEDLTRFLIIHYPAFAPRQLVQFLNETFPEMNPIEVSLPGIQEQTPIAALTIKKSEEMEPHEITMAADSEVIRSKLKESEVFEVPDTAPPEPSLSEEKAEQIKIPKSKVKINWRAFIHHPKHVKWAVLATAVTITGVFVVMKAPLFYGEFRSWLESQKTSPQPEIKQIQSKPAPAPTVQTTSLRLTSSPPGARIFVDDRDSGKSTPAVFDFLGRSSFPQKIGLFLDKYKFHEQSIDLKPGQITEQNVVLSPNYGGLSIRSSPEGAVLVLNGMPSGQTPFDRENIPPDSTFEITLSLDGYETWVGKTKVFGGKNEIVNVSLKKIKRKPEP